MPWYGGLLVGAIAWVLLAVTAWLGFVAWLRWRALVGREALRREQAAAGPWRDLGMSLRAEDPNSLSDSEEAFRELVARQRGDVQRRAREVVR